MMVAWHWKGDEYRHFPFMEDEMGDGNVISMHSDSVRLETEDCWFFKSSVE